MNDKSMIKPAEMLPSNRDTNCAGKQGLRTKSKLFSIDYILNLKSPETSTEENRLQENEASYDVNETPSPVPQITERIDTIGKFLLFPVCVIDICICM